MNRIHYSLGRFINWYLKKFKIIGAWQYKNPKDPKGWGGENYPYWTNKWRVAWIPTILTWAKWWTGRH